MSNYNQLKRVALTIVFHHDNIYNKTCFVLEFWKNTYFEV